MSRFSQRRGFSLVELLLSFVLLGVLLGLLVPAAYGLQQTAHQQATINSLKQICLAIHNANDTYKRLPPAYDKFSNWEFPASVHVHLLPFLEQDNLYRAFQNASGKGEVTETTIKVFIAADDNSNAADNVKGVQNFAANLRVFSIKGANTMYDKDMPKLGATEPGNARIPASFPDGTSNTIIFATKLAAAGDGGSRYAAEPNSKFAAFFGQNAAKKPADPSDPTATFQLQPAAKDARNSPLMAQSFTKNLLVGLGDGSVRDVAAAISAETWNRAVHPSDGMVLGNDW